MTLTVKGNLLGALGLGRVTARMAVLTMLLLALVALVMAASVRAEHGGKDQMNEAADMAEEMLAEWEVQENATRDITEERVFKVTPDGVEYVVKLHYYASSGRKLFSVSEKVSEEWLEEVERSRQLEQTGAIASTNPISSVDGGTKEAWDTGFTVRPEMHPDLIVIKTDERIESFEDAVQHAQQLLTNEPDPSVDPEVVKRFTEIAVDPWSWGWQLFRPATSDTESSYYILPFEKEVEEKPDEGWQEAGEITETPDVADEPEEKQEGAVDEQESAASDDSEQVAAPAVEEGTSEVKGAPEGKQLASEEKTEEVGFFQRLARGLFGFFG